MGKSYDTEMGGLNNRFPVTSWSQVLGSQVVDEVARRAVVAQLAGTYWRPVYCYLRRKGYDNETAKDLVQAFFVEVVLARDVFQRADPAKGRFRTLLLTALDRYVISVHRAGQATTRRPKAPHSIVHIDWSDAREPSGGSTPEEAYTVAWASALLETVLAELETELTREGKETEWSIFRARVLRPIMDGEEPVPFAELCSQHGIEPQSKAWQMFITAKVRFRKILHRALRPMVGTDGQVEQEIHDLLNIFTKK